MRLVTVKTAQGTCAAIEDAAGRRAITDGSGRPYRDIGELLARDADWRTAAAGATQALPADAPTLRPILESGAIICVGLNYRTHVLEMGRELPTAPTYFTKLSRALTDPGTDIAMPAASQKVDYEGELAVVIGAGGRNIPADRAWDAVAGLTLLNDVSMRDFQKRSLQFFAGKTWEDSTPMGPAIVTVDELDPIGPREIVTLVNGEVRQKAPLSDLIFDVPALIADLAQIFTLQPGDIIATGTTGGVGDAMKPPRYLQHGDVVEISIDGIGTLSNRFTRA